MRVKNPKFAAFSHLASVKMCRRSALERVIGIQDQTCQAYYSLIKFGARGRTKRTEIRALDWADMLQKLT